MRRGVSSQKSINSGDLSKFELEYKHTKITVLSDRDLGNEAMEFLERAYNELDRYCQKDPLFLISYYPVNVDENPPEIVRLMANSAKKAAVGPMASVAGTFSEQIGKFLLENGATEIIVDNGGDIFLKIKKERIIGIYAGNSKFSNKIGFKINPDETPMAICTSSSSVGHSISLGDSDAVSVVAKSCPLADAAATSIGNEVKGLNGMKKGLKKAREIKGIKGVLILRGNELGTWGKLPEIIRI